MNADILPNDAGTMDRGTTRDEMTARWSSLAKDIAASGGSPSADDVFRKGRLVVIGSGLSHIDLLGDAEDEIRQADHVFHCTNDRVTQVWLGKLRPDAFDLRILYDDGLPRHHTYIRMVEAIAHFVRQGKRVTAIFYGHPGVFATPAHRAIAILRAEGHDAKMRPGISALDYLVADLGFDPALPGLLSYEATDMLLNRRCIDPSLHVVIWQVGVVGEFAFNPRGFENRGFDLLLDVLAEIYGEDWEIAHYIAPQYVGVEPLIETMALSDLRDVEKRKNISSLSTFYIPPKMAVAMDKERAVELGLLVADQAEPSPQRDFVNRSYGEYEMDAIRSLAAFSVPPYYYVEQPSPAADFMLAVSNDAELRERYVRDPAAVLSAPEFDKLNDRARRLLTIHHPLAIGAALSEPPL
ncbi:SAM-dependent methyltransferase [Sphingomonas bacterium]|uniref:SAM-dependent methyltransferase n=1 Tax=Sphingomonas bacterium TaxID=1895847 RepID=UPI0015775CBF|nr:SAM-dependent methyltransferase [Sphingomonas bacterium]